MTKKIAFVACIAIGFAGSAWSSLLTDQWNGGAGDNDWNKSGNWNGGYVPYANNGINQVKAFCNKGTTWPIIDGTTSPAAEAFQLFIGSVSTPVGGKLEMNSGGVLNVTQGILIASQASYNGILTMAGGTINCADANVGQLGIGTLTISDGAINLTGTLSIAHSGSSANGTVHLDGGTITCGDFYMKKSGLGTALLDVAGGTLIITGDKTARIYSYGSMITAYGGLGTLSVTYDNGTNRTTVTAFMASPQASNPSPINGATLVAIHPTLSWGAGTGATSHDVYFGTVNPPVSFAGNVTDATFDPGTLLSSTTYYWRVDEVGSGTVTGPVWSFTTAEAKATNPSPANGSIGVAQDPTLTWTRSAAAVSHDVYFGTTNPPMFQINVVGASYTPIPLAANTTYYWRIDEKDGAGGIAAGDVWSFTTGSPIATYPYLSWRNDPTNSIVVNWFYPLAQGDSTVEYGLTGAYGSTVNIPTLTNFHHVELTGLTPSTTYHYRIRSSDHTVGTDNTFRTADVDTTAFRFVVFGDPRGVQTSNEPYYTRHQALCDWIAAQGYNFALETGDTVWGGGVTALYPLAAQNWWMDFYRLERNLSGSRPIMATMGNHEVQPPDSGGAVNYIYYYDLYEGAFPTNGTAGNRGRVYSFNYGNAHFVCMSSFQIDVTLQKNWLIADLTAAKANPNIKWIIVFMHAPLYTTTGHTVAQNMIDAWAPVFESYGVDIVFGGHNHCYERSYPIKSGQVVRDGEGPVYITNGMGGAEFNNTVASPLFAASYGSQIGGGQTVATAITINDKHLTVQAITNGNNTVVDSVELNKIRAGDLNRDGAVDLKDLGQFGGSWLDTGIWP
jgi:hypothetical protein